MISRSNRRNVVATVPLVMIAVTLLGTQAHADDPARQPLARGPLSPEQSQAQIRIDRGLRVELVASEPEIESPVAMAFDEDGRLWVVEMRDYPNGPAPGQPPEGRIRVLDDRDGDGRFETSAVFAEQLLFANGLMPWRGGLVVTAAPSIVVLRDSDGDGKADRRELLYEGFATQNPQLRVSHPNLGVDNWVYVANGLRGGKVVRSGRSEAKPIELGGMDFRFDLVHDRGEAVSGMGQFGLTFDDWGRRFVCDNRHHLRHVVLPNHDLKRNPYLAVPEVVEDVSELELGAGGAGGKIYPLSRNWTTSSLHTGRFTAACSVFIYRGDLLPESYRGSAFICDPTGNLVHQERLEPKGATFQARPAREGVEFLASPDDWFRPVFLAHGPDGALYVIDMCRAVIEHPEFMPVELKNRPDLTAGKDRGRIWRVVPDGQRERPPRPRLSHATTPALVALLSHRNAWLRITAQRLLLERQDPASVEPLCEVVRKSTEPLARLHAAWLLEAQGRLDENLVLRLLSDDHPRLREQAVLLSEPRLAKSATIRERVCSLAADPDAQVRFQVALSLGEWDSGGILDPLAQVALAGAGDRWTRLAVASAVPERAGALIVTLIKPEHGLTSSPLPDRLVLLRELAAAVGARRNPSEVAGVLEALLALEDRGAGRWQMAGLNGIADGMGRRGTQLSTFLESLPESPVGAQRARSLAERAGALLTQAAARAKDRHRDLEDRLDAVRLLAHAPWETAEPVLSALLTNDPLQDVRLAAVRALAAHPGSEVAPQLMKPWPGYTPAVRREVVSALLRQPERVKFLLDELEAGRARPGDLDAVATRLLVNDRRTEIRNRARALLQEKALEGRKEVLDRYGAALEVKGDPLRGREIFQQNCATCHRVAGIGVDVGPDIADTRTKTREALLGDILNPNQAIDSNYLNYVVSTKDGSVLSGIIAAETASSITLRRAEGQTEVVLREDVDEIRSTGASLMPDGLEQSITVEQMGDLLTFLKDWRYLEGDVPHKSEK